VTGAAPRGEGVGNGMACAIMFAREGAKVVLVIIGSVHTPMVAHMGADARERRRQMVPMQTEGTAWDIAQGAVYLASDESRWVTGIQLPIDGGLINIRPRPI
jgi:NAD(P)-dependent dehydrogenase (short-subunit alcohol dehydrogenase family)